MSKKTLTLAGVVAILATAATLLFAAGPKDNEEGKFHLVYLVSAMDLKPGSKVTVDPVFFTDGKTVKNFHLFCRKGMHPLKLSQVAADRQFIESYCSRKPFTFDPKGFHILNNHGQQLTVGPIDFKVIGEFTHTGATGHPIIPPKDSVMMGHTQVRTYTPGTIEAPKWLRNDGAPEYFFLMSRDQQILEKIVPVSRASPAEVGALTKRVVEFSKIARGRVSGGLTNSRDIEKASVCYAPNPITEFRLDNPLIVDLDLDGRLDMFVNVFSVHRIDSDPERPLVACFTTYRILGNGETILAGNHNELLSPHWGNSSGGSYQRYLLNDYAVQTKMLFIRLPVDGRRCTYRLAYSGQPESMHPSGYVLGANSADCGRPHQFPKHPGDAH